MGAAAASLWIAFRLRHNGPRIWQGRAAAAVVMGAAIVGMHYTGMAAAGFPVGSICLAATGAFTLTELAVMVILATVSILGIALLTAVYDARLAARSEMAAVSERTAQERQQLLERERLARAEAERLSAMKDQFLATLSHELRTPLNAILGWTQLLQIKKDPGAVERGLQVIERNARLQAQLIEDLLDMSRIVSGNVRLELAKVDVAEVIHAALDAVRPAALAKRIELAADVPVGIARARADAARLQQVLWNLLSNAVKFTPEDGRVAVALRVEGGEVLVTVSDSGIGIDAGFLPHVFEPFRQADASTTRRQGGLGIGLAIVRQLVELHGGRAEVASDGLGHGARFTVRLPLLQGAGQAIPGASSAPPDPAALQAGKLLAGVDLLVVEDDPDARDVLGEVLVAAGARVTPADSAAAALRLLHETRPDVLVSDIGMPQMDGFELLRRVRRSADPRIARIPALALTAFTRPEDERKALEAGFDAFERKPFELARLREVVAGLAGRTLPAFAAPAGAATAAPEKAKAPALELRDPAG